MPSETFHIYILANRTRVLYIGLSRNLPRRIYQHRHGPVPGFSRRYNIKRLVYFEETGSARSATARERQLKGWSRAKKIGLIEAANPEWLDLAAGWFG
ncbi:MAG: GIY-YIG nuclease family protein [Gemmatimonadota bacterium]